MYGARSARVTGRTGTGYVEGILESLKDFQRRTAEYAFERLYKADNSTQRFLLADEVGLGVTLMAASVMAQAIDQRNRPAPPARIRLPGVHSVGRAQSCYSTRP